MMITSTRRERRVSWRAFDDEEPLPDAYAAAGGD
jgi:hypothetical protein